jgi:hypothetical protein
MGGFLFVVIFWFLACLKNIKNCLFVLRYLGSCWPVLGWVGKSCCGYEKGLSVAFKSLIRAIRKAFS